MKGITVADIAKRRNVKPNGDPPTLYAKIKKIRAHTAIDKFSI